MALQEVTTVFKRLRLDRTLNTAWRQQCLQQHRSASTTSPASQESKESDIRDLEKSSFLRNSAPVPLDATGFDPVATARKRGKYRLPPSRYNFRPPKYYRGPLHPHQPPPVTDPASRQFIPGPFSLPRLEQTFETTVEPDLMTLAYVHYPPGVRPPKKGARLREWVGDSPYFKNRPLRGPRGYSALPLLKRRMTFRNVPRLERVTVHMYSKDATNNSSYLHVAGMILQAITGVRPQVHKTRKATAAFNVKKGAALSLTCELIGEDMYHFLSKVVDVVMPKIKDYKGVRATTGDSSGNLTFGMTPEQVAHFPEVEINYDSYPPKHIPGLHITIHTTATQDREARLLLGAVGVPFFGKMID